MGKSSRGGDAVRTDVLRPLGLITTPNPYGQFPEGALTDATNCVIRRPGQLQAAPSFTNYTPLTTASADDLLHHMCPLNAGHVFSFHNNGSNVWKVSEGIPGGTVNAGAFPPGGVSATNLFAQARVGSTRSRERMLVNSNRGVMVGDVMAPASAGDRTLRWAGMAQPMLDVLQISTTAGTAIPLQTMVGYGAVMTREFSDGYIVKSVPSVTYKVLNSSATTTAEVTLRVTWSPFAGVVAGDYVELYRTDGLSTTSLDADPGVTLKLIFRQKTTSTDISNGYLNVIDKTLMTAPFYTTSGRELYTNPYQEGALGENRQPDIAGAIETFKGFTFYGNLTERGQSQFTIPAGFIIAGSGSVPDYVRTAGIGSRSGVGTWSNGGTTVSAISASDIKGVVVGQYIVAPSVTLTSQVSSVGATSFTISGGTFVGAGAGGQFSVVDVIEVNGYRNVLFSAGFFAVGFAPYLNTTSSGVEAHTSQPIPLTNAVVTSSFTGLTVTYEPIRPVGTLPTETTGELRIRATNGSNYSPPFPEITSTVQTFSPITTTNLLRWSKDSEPEHVPSTNETQVGSGAIIAMESTKDALWIACTDGVYRLSGDGGSWRVDLVAPSLVLCSPRCMVNMRETIYAYTNYGFGAITDSGFAPISHTRVRSLLPGPPFTEDPYLILGRNDGEGEVIISPGIVAFTHYVWNTFTEAFTRIYDPANHFLFTTAFAWQETPASGAQAFLWGVSEGGLQPALFQWNSVAAYLSPGVTFTQFYADTAFQTKQWIDITYLFMSEAAGYLLIGSVSNQAIASNVPIVATPGAGGDAACTIGVTRRYAISPKIIIGFGIGSAITANRVHLEGVSVRYVPIGSQQVAR